jgi:hypothetical protein
MKRFLLTTIAIGGMLAGTARADIILPSTNNLRFEGISAFSTSFLPIINTTTGALIPSGNPTVTAFGEINTILNSANSNDKGSITNGQELTFTYTGATLNPVSVSAPVFTGTSVSYTITSQVVGGTLRMFADNGSGANLNTAAFIGTNGGSVPTAASDGDPGDAFLVANTPADAIANIVISYFRATPTSDFTSLTVLMQGLNTGGFAISGGDVLTSHPNLAGKLVQVSQDGLFSTPFTATDGNSPVINTLVEGDVVMATTSGPGNVVPEPASLALVLGGLLLITGTTGRRASRNRN